MVACCACVLACCWHGVFLCARVEQGKKLAPEMETKIRKRLLLYLLVFVLCSIWGLINRIYVVLPAQLHNYTLYRNALDSRKHGLCVCVCATQTPAAVHTQAQPAHVFGGARVLLQPAAGLLELACVWNERAGASASCAPTRSFSSCSTSQRGCAVRACCCS